MKIYTLVVLMFFVQQSTNAQEKVAGFSVGELGTGSYERLEFWTNDGKRTTIYYTFGKSEKRLLLTYGGTTTLKGERCFKVSFTNGYTLYIRTEKQKLRVIDEKATYNKIFSWEYEGPVNGIGTYCKVCATNEEDAVTLIESCFVK